MFEEIMAMKLFVKRSGGFANVGPIQGELDTEELPPDLAEKVNRFIKPTVLATRGKTSPLMVDGQQISVGFRSSDDGTYQEYEIDESCANPELLDLCNELVNEMVRNRLNK